MQKWNKEGMLLSLMDEPAAVLELTAKCCRLLKRFLAEFQKQVGDCNMCHCPYAWAPARLDSPIPSTSSWIAEATIWSGDWWRPV